MHLPDEQHEDVPTSPNPNTTRLSHAGQHSATNQKGSPLNMNYSRVDRLKGAIIEKVLPKFNLTSYNNLTRVRQMLQDQILSEQQRADELHRQMQTLQTQHGHAPRGELNTLRSEHDQAEMKLQRLELQYEDVNRRLERMMQEYTESIAQRDEAIRVRDAAAAERDQLISQNAQLQGYREQSERLYSQVAKERDALAGQHEQLTAQWQQLTREHDENSRNLEKLTSENSRLAAYHEQSERLHTHITGERNRLANEVNVLLHMLKDAQGVLTEQYEPAPSVPPAPDLSVIDVVRRVTEELHNPRTLYDVRQTLQEYYADDQDDNFQCIMEIYQEAIGRNIPYWDIRTAVRVASRILKPTTYLEVGTRRGWSLAQMLTEAPDAVSYIFDVWQENYANAQGSPRYVLNKMQQVTGASPSIEFVNGSSHDTLPRFFNNQVELSYGIPPREFDLITIDGDHSLIGAWQDLHDVFPHVRVGGMILFDDLESAGEPAEFPSQYERPPLPDNLETLRDVWHKMQALHPNFVFIDCSRLRFQAGIAIRLS